MDDFSLIAPLLEAAGVRMSPPQRSQLERYAELLAHWNRRMNLVGDAGRIFSRHLLDCLMLETLPWPPEPLEILDVGSGAGLPGIVTAIMHPDCTVHAVETTAKKATFQQVAAATLGLNNFLPRRADVHRLARAAEHREAYGIVLARAFADLHVLLDLAAAFLRPGGELWAMKGRKLAQEQATLAARSLAPFEREAVVHPYDFPEADTGGVIAVYRKRGGSPRTPGRDEA